MGSKGSAKRRALGTQYFSFKYGIPKAQPLVGVLGAKPPGGFQGGALNSQQQPRNLPLPIA